MGRVPMPLPPSKNSALLFWPFHQKNTPIDAETSNIRAKMKYSSHPNLALSSSLGKSPSRTLSPKSPFLSCRSNVEAMMWLNVEEDCFCDKRKQNQNNISWSTRPTTVPDGSDHYFHTECPSVLPSVLPSVPKLQNQATITAGRDCGLVEWIIDYSSLVSF